MQELLILSTIPLLAAVATAITRDIKFTRFIVPVLMWLQIIALILTCLPAIMQDTALQFTNDFRADRTGTFFMLLTTFVVAASLTHASTFFEQEQVLRHGHKLDYERIFYACSSLLLLAMTFVFLSDNLGFLWIAIEATTLCSAPLVYFARTQHALEATWKYLIVCSVALAFALLGTILIFASTQHGGMQAGTLNLTQLLSGAPSLQYPLLRAGYIFCLLGYGTKAGIFPLHNWLPDAHSEAPAPASAMLSGSLLNCALFAIWRLSELVNAAQHSNLAYMLPLALGTITVVAGSLFLVHQHAIKRLWAYSSIENVGLMMVAIAFSSPSLFFLQALNHSIAKVALFLLSGNIIQATGCKKLSEVRGILTIAPVWGILFALCAFAVTGAPPFGAFISEWLILAHGADHKAWLIVGSLVAALALSFVAVSIHVGKLLFGSPPPHAVPCQNLQSSLMPALLTILTVITGVTSLPLCLVSLP